MKRCPTCNQVFFDEALSFCTDDGTILETDATTSPGTPPNTSGGSDLMATMISPGGSNPGYAPPSGGSSSGSSPGSSPGSGAGYAPPSYGGSTPGYATPPSPGSQPGYGSTPYGGPVAPQTGWQPPAQDWQAPPPPGYGMPVQAPSQGIAITSLIFGLITITIGWCYIGFLTSPVAIITAIVALVQIKNDPQRNGGKPLAIVGLVTGLLFWVGFILLFFFGMLSSIMSR